MCGASAVDGILDSVCDLVGRIGGGTGRSASVTSQINIWTPIFREPGQMGFGHRLIFGRDFFRVKVKLTSIWEPQSNGYSKTPLVFPRFLTRGGVRGPIS